MTRCLLRRALAATVLVLVASCGFLLAALAPEDIADPGSGFGATPAHAGHMSHRGPELMQG